MAGPKRPQDRVNLPDVKKNFEAAFGGAHKPVANRHEWRRHAG
jgi:aconitase A